MLHIFLNALLTTTSAFHTGRIGLEEVHMLSGTPSLFSLSTSTNGRCESLDGALAERRVVYSITV